MQNLIYDLHSHSTASDGILSPTELVQRAAAQAVNVLALTDHDTIAGLEEAAIQANQLNIRLINGVEISTLWENREIHIVGLDFEVNSCELADFLAHQAKLRQQRAVEIGQKLEKIGIPTPFEGAKALATGEVTRAHYARYLIQIGKVTNDQQAFKRYLAQGKSCYVKPNWGNIENAIRIIHEAGGKAVLAHPLRYNFTARWLKRLIADFMQYGGDAMEVCSCGQTLDQRQLLVRWANEFGLKASVGSDFHFPCGWIELGKSLHLPENCEFVL